jgi:hypothetical protein
LLFDPAVDAEFPDVFEVTGAWAESQAGKNVGGLFRFGLLTRLAGHGSGQDCEEQYREANDCSSHRASLMQRDSTISAVETW